jgi:hypothetical protein
VNTLVLDFLDHQLYISNIALPPTCGALSFMCEAPYLPTLASAPSAAYGERGVVVPCRLPDDRLCRAEVFLERWTLDRMTLFVVVNPYQSYA